MNRSKRIRSSFEQVNSCYPELDYFGKSMFAGFGSDRDGGHASMMIYGGWLSLEIEVSTLFCLLPYACVSFSIYLPNKSILLLQLTQPLLLSVKAWPTPLSQRRLNFAFRSKSHQLSHPTSILFFSSFVAYHLTHVGFLTLFIGVFGCQEAQKHPSIICMRFRSKSFWSFDRGPLFILL